MRKSRYMSLNLRLGVMSNWGSWKLKWLGITATLYTGIAPSLTWGSLSYLDGGLRANKCQFGGPTWKSLREPLNQKRHTWVGRVHFIKVLKWQKLYSSRSYLMPGWVPLWSTDRRTTEFWGDAPSWSITNNHQYMAYSLPPTTHHKHDDNGGLPGLVVCGSSSDQQSKMCAFCFFIHHFVLKLLPL